MTENNKTSSDIIKYPAGLSVGAPVKFGVHGPKKYGEIPGEKYVIQLETAKKNGFFASGAVRNFPRFFGVGVSPTEFLDFQISGFFSMKRCRSGVELQDSNASLAGNSCCQFSSTTRCHRKNLNEKKVEIQVTPISRHMKSETRHSLYFMDSSLWFI